MECNNKSLNELKEIQHNAMEENIVKILGINRNDFKKYFTDETDAKKRTQYILDISKIAEDKIAEEKNKNPENWKQEYYNQMKIETRYIQKQDLKQKK